MFITALTSVRHLSLSWANPIQSIYPHPTSWRSVLILSTHLRLGLPSGLLPFGFPTKTLYTHLSSPMRATCPAHLQSKHPACECFLTKFLQGGVVSTSSNPKAGGPPLVGCPRLLIQYIRSYRPYRRPFLYPQPEDAPCRGDRDPLYDLGYLLPIYTQVYRSLPLGGNPTTVNKYHVLSYLRT